MHTFQTKWRVGLYIYCSDIFWQHFGQFRATSRNVNTLILECTRWPHIPLSDCNVLVNTFEILYITHNISNTHRTCSCSGMHQMWSQYSSIKSFDKNKKFGCILFPDTSVECCVCLYLSDRGPIVCSVPGTTEDRSRSANHSGWHSRILGWSFVELQTRGI